MNRLTAPHSPVREVERDITIQAPVDIVWRALTDAAQLVRWFPLEARVDPGPAGAIWMKWESLGYEAESKIEAWEPERHLRYAFPLHGAVRLSTDYYLSGEKGQTVLRVVTSGFGEGDDWDEWFAGVSSGWDFELRSLKHYLERHQGKHRTCLVVHFDSFLSPAQTWQRLVGGASAWLGFEDSPVEGTRYSARTATGEVLTGTVEQWRPPRQAVLTVDQYNDGLMRIELERLGAAVVWLAAWDVPDSAMKALEQNWKPVIHRFIGIPTENMKISH